MTSRFPRITWGARRARRAYQAHPPRSERINGYRCCDPIHQLSLVVDRKPGRVTPAQRLLSLSTFMASVARVSRRPRGGRNSARRVVSCASTIFGAELRGVARTVSHARSHDARFCRKARGRVASHNVDNKPRVVCACVVRWSSNGPVTVGPEKWRREWTAASLAIWVQLLMQNVADGAEQRLFEGSEDAWSNLPLPPVDRREVDGVLKLVGLDDATLDECQSRLLCRLPYLYARGVQRMAREVRRRSCAASRARLYFFPTVGFDRREEAIKVAKELQTRQSPNRIIDFVTVRMNVAVIRNVVVTVRLPDVWWDHSLQRYQYGERGPTDGRINVPDRYFPSVEDLNAEDVAEAIAMHQASTAREVSRVVRPELTTIRSRWQEVTGPDERRKRAAERRKRRDRPLTLAEGESVGTGRECALADACLVSEATDKLYRLDRQLARLLRRFGADDVGAETDSRVRSVPSEVTSRYRFALDELRSVQADCLLASDAVTRAMRVAAERDRERFHFLAAVLGSAVLIPTLVASIYGANVQLPGKDKWHGFTALLLFMFAFAALALFAISVMLARDWIPTTRWLRKGQVMVAAGVLAFIAGVAAVWVALA